MENLVKYQELGLQLNKEVIIKMREAIIKSFDNSTWSAQCEPMWMDCFNDSLKLYPMSDEEKKGLGKSWTNFHWAFYVLPLKEAQEEMEESLENESSETDNK